MFERIKRTLGFDADQGMTDAGRRQQSRDSQQDRLQEERQRLGGSDRSKVTLEQKRQEMIDKQLEAERTARENGNRPDMDAPKPANDDRSREEILTRRMKLDLGEREQQMATERYDSIDLRNEYWWHPAFNQSERAKERRSGPDPLLDDDRDGRQVTHYDDDQSLAWDDPQFEKSRGGFVQTDDWNMMMENAKEREQEQERQQERQQDRDRDDRNRQQEQEQDRDDRDVQDRYFGAMSEDLDDQLPTFDDDDISGDLTPARDDLDDRDDRERDRDRDRGRGR